MKNLNPYLVYGASWAGFVVGLLAWSLIVGLFDIMPVYNFAEAGMFIIFILVMVLVGTWLTP